MESLKLKINDCVVNKTYIIRPHEHIGRLRMLETIQTSEARATEEKNGKSSNDNNMRCLHLKNGKSWSKSQTVADISRNKRRNKIRETKRKKKMSTKGKKKKKL